MLREVHRPFIQIDSTSPSSIDLISNNNVSWSVAKSVISGIRDIEILDLEPTAEPTLIAHRIQIPREIDTEDLASQLRTQVRKALADADVACDVVHADMDVDLSHTVSALRR